MTLTRSQIMARVKSSGTSCELAVRKLLTSMGYRYRLHGKHLPGSPDVYFIGKKKTIFVNGCFWHHHEVCGRGKIPKTNREYWENKLLKNVERDEKNSNDLESMGWGVLIIWECEIVDLDNLDNKLRAFLNDSR